MVIPRRVAVCVVGLGLSLPLRAAAPEQEIPRPAEAARRITLAEALAAADARAFDVVSAEASRARADAARAGAAAFLPENPSVGVAVGPRFSDGVGVDAEVSIQQDLDVFGVQGLRRDAAAQTATRIEADIRAVRFTVHRDVHAAFHFALVARERQKMADEFIRFAEDVAAIAKKRVDAGEVSSLSTTLADAELAQARQSAIAARRDLDVRLIELARNIGLPTSPPLEPVGDLDASRTAPGFDEMLTTAREHQPTLLALTAAVDEAKARFAAAERGAIGSPSVGVSYSAENVGAGGVGDHVVLGSVSIPLPLWQQNNGAIADARADVVEAETALRVYGLRLDASVRSAKARVDAEHERLAVFGSDVLPGVTAGLEKVQKAFELGQIDVLDVSVARERLLAVRREALEAYESYFAAVADLELEVGADLWNDPHTSETP